MAHMMEVQRVLHGPACAQQSLTRARTHARHASARFKKACVFARLGSESKL